MTTMTISPIQFNKDHVTKGEFGKHVQYVKDGFEKVFEQIDNVEFHLIERFDKVDNRIDLLESNMNKKFSLVDKRFDDLELKINNITNLLTKKS